MRARLKSYTERAVRRRTATICNAANEIEGFLFKGRDAERHYHETGSFEFISTGGYYHSLPGDALRLFIDTAAEVQRAMGFANEKDHPEVAPSQFEMNYCYTEATIAADQVLLYKLICRQVAARLDMTASFLPKPVTGVNGSGMHTNLSVSAEGQEPVLGPEGPGQALADAGWEFIDRILTSAHGHLPAPQLERQRLPPARPALRGAEPDQGLGDRPRLDGPHPDRQREVGPHRGALDRAGRQPVPGDLHACSGPASRGRSRTATETSGATAPGSCRTTSTTRSGSSRAAGSPPICSARTVQQALRRAEAGLSRALPQGARRADQDSGDPVPPRGDEPVPLEQVLGSQGARG